MNEDNAIPGLRDFVAVSALAVVSRADSPLNPSVVAEYCYQMADAFLVERAKGPLEKQLVGV